jgi:hypothetical protein
VSTGCGRLLVAVERAPVVMTIQPQPVMASFDSGLNNVALSTTPAEDSPRFAFLSICSLLKGSDARDDGSLFRHQASELYWFGYDRHRHCLVARHRMRKEEEKLRKRYKKEWKDMLISRPSVYSSRTNRR